MVKTRAVGIDIDIANAIGEALGVWRSGRVGEMEFNFLIAAMKSGKVDLVLQGLPQLKSVVRKWRSRIFTMIHIW